MPRASAAKKKWDGVRRMRGRPPQPNEMRAEKDAQYRLMLMETAEEIFADMGYTATKMEDIARAAGTSLTTLYKAYGSKVDLYREVLIARNTELLNLVMIRGLDIMLKPKSIEQVLWQMRTQLKFMLERPNYLRMQLREGHVWYHRAAWPTYAEQQLWEHGMKVMAQMFQWGMEKGLFIPGDPYDQGRMVLSLQQTRLACYVNAEMKEDHEAVIERIQADFVRNFCRSSIVEKVLRNEGTQLTADIKKRIAAISNITGQPAANS